MTDFARLLEVLTGANVGFIVIGGFAATAHGSAHVTADLDIIYQRTPENIGRLADGLAPCNLTLVARLRACRFISTLKLSSED